MFSAQDVDSGPTSDGKKITSNSKTYTAPLSVSTRTFPSCLAT